jgi:RNA polymerase sigma factor (sigma-70 family)
MPGPDATDEQLLVARDAASFELFYVRHVDAMLGFFARRTFDAEMAADLCAETFAAALASRHRFRPGGPPATAWLFGIGAKKLADAQRRGYADMRARRRLGMERIELSDQVIARIERLGEGDETRALMERLPPEQRAAIAAHVVDERPYGEIAGELQTSEAVVRKRVSRGLATMRQRMGARR